MRFLRACLAGALVATPVGALAQGTMNWQILHVDTQTHVLVDAGVYAVLIAVLAVVTGALDLPLLWAARRLARPVALPLTLVVAAVLGWAAFVRMMTWSIPVDEHARILGVLVAFHGAFLFVLTRPAAPAPA